MKLFACSHCGNRVFFENVKCLKCKNALGFDTQALSIIAIKRDSDEADAAYEAVGAARAGKLNYCANVSHAACNWLLPYPDPTGLCRACDLNRTIPSLVTAENTQAWRELEIAKKRLVYSLMRFGLPFDDPGLPHGPLTFDFKQDAMTGHHSGVITIALKEADSVERERQRKMFDEPYRALLGHLRHEAAHFYWQLLVVEAGKLEPYRALFGDERVDYAGAIASYYEQGAPADWAQKHVSAYAASHPWEDWAETWAHYLHMVDAVDTADAVGMEPRSAGFSFGMTWPFRSRDVYRDEGFEGLMERWVPLTIAMNSLSRSMGHRDFYPFVTPSAAYDKLRFVHDVIRDGAARR